MNNYLEDKQPRFKKPFYISLGIHGGLLLVILIAAISLPEKVFKQQPVTVVSATTISKPAVQPAPKPVKKVSKPKPKPVVQKRIADKKIAIKKPIVKKTPAKAKPKKNVVKKPDQKRIAQRKVEKKRARKQALIAKRKRIAEQKRLAALKAKKIAREVDRYNALILQSIGNHWIIPPGVNKQLTSKLAVQVAPSGAVLNVELLKSSGNVQLDRSAVAAVYKASPLPVPSSKSLFDKQFKQLTLLVRPEDVG